MCVIPEKILTLQPRRKFLPPGGAGEKNLFLIIVSVLGCPKGVVGLTFNFLCGGGMVVFWNDQVIKYCIINSLQSSHIVYIYMCATITF
jgi:hypothetical protein